MTDATRTLRGGHPERGEGPFYDASMAVLMQRSIKTLREAQRDMRTWLRNGTE